MVIFIFRTVAHSSCHMKHKQTKKKKSEKYGMKAVMLVILEGALLITLNYSDLIALLVGIAGLLVRCLSFLALGH